MNANRPGFGSTFVEAHGVDGGAFPGFAQGGPGARGFAILKSGG
jgi:hypothetical protein